MDNAHPRMKDHQKLLRNLMIHEMLIRILKSFNPNAPDCKYVCKFIKNLVMIYLKSQYSSGYL